MIRLGWTIPRWWIGNWCIASPPCSDITIRTTLLETVVRKSYCQMSRERNCIISHFNLSTWATELTLAAPTTTTDWSLRSTEDRHRRSGVIGSGISFCGRSPLFRRSPRPSRLRVLAGDWCAALIARTQNGRPVINNCLPTVYLSLPL